MMLSAEGCVSSEAGGLEKVAAEVELSNGLEGTDGRMGRIVVQERNYNMFVGMHDRGYPVYVNGNEFDPLSLCGNMFFDY